jgi:cell wall assembly regulator SMI1
VLDPQGRITQVIWINGDKATEGCVTRAWQGLVVPHTQAASALVVTVTISG